jgi:hypothetical protein
MAQADKLRSRATDPNIDGSTMVFFGIFTSGGVPRER